MKIEVGSIRLAKAGDCDLPYKAHVDHIEFDQGAFYIIYWRGYKLSADGETRNYGDY